jgi:histidyl-tRNA synthetase
LEKVAPGMCADCQRRAVTNPLRVLDCKVEADQPIIEKLPTILDHLCEPCREHFAMVRAHLAQRCISYELRPRLVRGLDYYTRTTFEVVHGSLGAQNSILGGGRYDGLAESLGSKTPAPGIGFSIGEDRLVSLLEQADPKLGVQAVDLFVAPLDDVAFERCSQVARELRHAGKTVELASPGKLKRVLETANKIGARYALIVGESEIAEDVYTLKNMATGEQRKVSRAELLNLN